jgi:RNA polymerase sigma-B factor
MVALLPAGQNYPDRGSLTARDDNELIAMVQSLPRESDLREAAGEELVRRYDFLVHHAARHYGKTPEPVEELIQAGYVGLVKAINRFDATRGTGLSAYAEPCITGEIKRHFRDKRWQIHVRRGAQELRAEMVTAREELTQQLGRIPADQEVAAHLGLDAEEQQEAHRAQAAFQAMSLNAPLSAGPDAPTFAELLGSDDPGWMTAWAWKPSGHIFPDCRGANSTCWPCGFTAT